ncbi:MAG: chorismate mutase [Aquisalinus sp.]|nr:chorismate mutase [Aquisalinus sp.]
MYQAAMRNGEEKKILAPEACETMEEVRAGVDDLDRQLVELLVTRQGYMEAAARIKPAESDVRVPWRIEQVVENVLAEAKEKGLSSRIAEPVWRVLIEKCIEHEGEKWRTLRAQD